MPGLVRKNPSLKISRAADFGVSGNYDVRREDGSLVTQIFRDPENRQWYEVGPGHYTEHWLGDSQKEAVERIASRESPVKNPTVTAEDEAAAIDKFKEFHRYDPKRLEYIEGLKIPRRVRSLGAAKYTLYRSSKVDPSTLKKPKKAEDYIHEHDAGVHAYSTAGTPDTDVPREFYEVTAVTSLDKCLGFAMRDGVEAECTHPLPELACTPDGKCLLVIQGKKKVLAMMWGGALGVFARGIDG